MSWCFPHMPVEMTQLKVAGLAPPLIQIWLLPEPGYPVKLTAAPPFRTSPPAAVASALPPALMYPTAVVLAVPVLMIVTLQAPGGMVKALVGAVPVEIWPKVSDIALCRPSVDAEARRCLAGDGRYRRTAVMVKQQWCRGNDSATAGKAADRDVLYASSSTESEGLC